MTLPVPNPDPLVTYDRHGADDFAALGLALATHRATQSPVLLVYAPTNIAHHRAAPAPAALPTPRASAPSFPGTEINATGCGGTFIPPTYVSALAPIPKRRSLAPLGFLVCGWSTLAAVLGSAVTGGSPVAIGATLSALTGTAASAVAIYRRQT